MRHKDNLSKFPLLDHSLQIPFLILGGIWIVSRLIRSSPPKKIKGHYSPCRREIGKKAIIEMKIIWEAVHQDDRRLLPRIFSDVNAVLISLHELLYEIHLLPEDSQPVSARPALSFFSNGNFRCASRAGDSL